MSNKLTREETTELLRRFKKVSLHEDVETEVIVHTVKSGRIVKGYVSEDGELMVSDVIHYLAG